MIQDYFHRWEQQLADISKNDRKVRPFEWGVEWIGDQGSGIGDQGSGIGDQGSGTGDQDPRARVTAWVDEVMKDTDAFFTPKPTS